ncbi:Structural maintenance of chromosomes protein [Dirofilaria immitis]
MSKRQTTSCLSVVPKCKKKCGNIDRAGKSALFAALNIGLGGRGNQNERGNAVKQYIKDGQKAEISHWNTILRELRDEKERIVAMQRNDLARFGASVPQIVSLIKQNAAKFSKEPIGPIGHSCSLRHYWDSDVSTKLKRPMFYCRIL